MKYANKIFIIPSFVVFVIIDKVDKLTIFLKSKLELKAELVNEYCP